MFFCKVSMTSCRFLYYCYVPSKIFNFKVLSFLSNLSPKIKFNFNYKYKKYLIVSLRSPKHFKIGRNHYQIYKKKIILQYSLNKNNFSCTFTDRTYKLISDSTLFPLVSAPSIPFSNLSQIKYTFSVLSKFRII